MKSPSSLRFTRALLVLVLGCATALHASAQGRDPAVPIAGMGGSAGVGGIGGMMPVMPVTLASMGPVPANGAVLIMAEERADELVFTLFPENAAITTPVGGTLTQVEGVYWAWRPETPLVAGTYVLEGHLDDGAGPFLVFAENIRVTDAIELHQPALTSEPAVSWVSQLLGQVCCQLWTETGIEVGTCAPTGQRASVQLGPGLSSPEAQALLGQYLYRIWPAGEDASQYAFNPWGTPLVLELSEQADEYCYEIETLSINDLSREQHDTLEPRCASHGELSEVGDIVLELPDGFLDRSACHEPPSMLAEQWCEVNEACGDDVTAEGCVLYGYLCEGESLPTWSPDGAGGTMAGTSGDAGGVGGDAGEVDSGVVVLAGSGGMGGGSGGHCSVARPVSSRPSAFFALLLAGALVALRARRAR
jgi:hypothetical protein